MPNLLKTKTKLLKPRIEKGKTEQIKKKKKTTLRFSPHVGSLTSRISLSIMYGLAKRISSIRKTMITAGPQLKKYKIKVIMKNLKNFL